MATSPFSALPQVLSRREREFLRGANTIAREAAKAAGAAAVNTTRVDTGLARSNWRATVGAPAASIIPPYAPGSKLGIGEQGNAIGAISQQTATFSSWDAAREIPAFITNNVPYISILNFGGPRVGPGNMLAMAVQAWTIAVKTPRRILR